MKKYIALIPFTLLPGLALAQTHFTQTRDIIQSLADIISYATYVAAGLALLAFFWGLAKFIFGAGDPKKIDEGKNIMKWGIIALFVMVSIVGIIQFIQGELNIDNTGGTPIQVPQGPAGPGGFVSL